jgi:hypothetical protein
MSNPTPEYLDVPGKYYEDEPLNVEAARRAGSIAINSQRAGGQWAAQAYPGEGIASSQIPDDAPLLGSIMTDVEGISEDPLNNGGPRLEQEKVLPIVLSWLEDRGLKAQEDRITELRGGMYEYDGYMGAVIHAFNAE